MACYENNTTILADAYNILKCFGGFFLMKVKIYTIAYNRPEFIPLQQMTFLKFLKDDFEYIVINSAVTESNDLEIKETCKQLGIMYIDCDTEKRRLGDAAYQWTFDNYMKYDANTIVALLDSDMFMISEFSISDYMNGYDVAGIPESRGYVSYLHPRLTFFNMDTLPNKDDMNLFGGNVEGFITDIGGHLYYWLENNKGLRVRKILSSGQICSANNNLILLPEKMEANDYQFEIIEKTYVRSKTFINQIHFILTG
jgi:hypothetical protein